MSARLVFTIIAAVVLASCTVSNQYELVSYDAEAMESSPVSVFMQKPANRLLADCNAFASSSVLKYCDLQPVKLQLLHAEFVRSGVFPDVFYADDSIPYRIAIATARYNQDDAAGMGNAVLCGATLFLAPCNYKLLIKVDARVFWYDVELAAFDYELPVEHKISLLNKMGDGIESDVARSIVSHIIKDIQTQQIMSDAHRIAVLQSSNYERDLILPQSLEPYSLMDIQIYDHPFLGARAYYQHAEDKQDRTDVYVYPIRAVVWDDVGNILQQEAMATRAEIELMSREFGNFIHHVSDDVILQMGTADSLSPTLYFDASYTDRQVLNYVTRTYLTVRDDKFIKIRHTSLADGADHAESAAFANALIPAIVVPEESLFMARVRQAWRSKDLLQ